MVFLYIIEWLLIGLVLTFVVTQFAIPMALNRPILPVLRWRKPVQELSRAIEAEDSALMEREIKARRHSVKTIRGVQSTPRRNE